MVRRFPAPVAAVTGGGVLGVHRTSLDPRSPARAGVAVPRKALGRVCGRAVQFRHAAAALSAGSLGAFAPLPGLARRAIARDYDVAAVGLPALRARLAPLFRYAGGEDSLHEGNRWREGEGAPQWDTTGPT